MKWPLHLRNRRLAERKSYPAGETGPAFTKAVVRHAPTIARMRSLRTQGSGVAKVSAAGFAERLIAGGAQTASSSRRSRLASLPILGRVLGSRLARSDRAAQRGVHEGCVERLHVDRLGEVARGRVYPRAVGYQDWPEGIEPRATEKFGGRGWDRTSDIPSV